MTDLDTLLDSLPLPPEAGLADTAHKEDAAAHIAAGLLSADSPVAWLNQLADALSAFAAHDPDAAAGLPEGLDGLNPPVEAHLNAWQAALHEALEAQALAYADLLPLGAQPDSYPRRWLQDQVALRQAALVERFGATAPSAESLAPYQALGQRRFEAWQQVHDLLAAELSAEYLQAQTAALQRLIQEAVLAEACLQAQERLVPEAAWLALKPQLEAGTAYCLAVTWQGAPLRGTWVLTLASAWHTNVRPLPLLLWVQGEGGGLLYADDLEALRAKVASTLEAPLETAIGTQVTEAPSREAGVVFEPRQGDMNEAVADLVAYWAEQLSTAHASASAHEAFEIEAQEVVTDQARAALAIATDTTRQRALGAVERQWQADALLQHLPAWLLARSQAEREAFAAELAQYHQAAAAFEHWMDATVPAFPAYAGQLLAQRIQRDLGIALVPTAPVLTRPVSVTFEWFGPGAVLEPPPEGTYPSPLPADTSSHGMRWVASDAWEEVTLEQLAMENLTAHEDAAVERLKMAQWAVPELSAAYLLRTLPQLDPLGRYQRELMTLLDPATSSTPARLRRPFELELCVLAQVAHWEGRLGTAGLQMLRTAAQVHDAPTLAEQGLRIHWLVVKAREELGRTIEGCCALVAGEAERTLLCLPGAPDGYDLLERESLDQALEALRDGIRLRPRLAEYVAARLGGEPSLHLAYLREAGLRQYGGYLSAPASLDQTLAALQLHDRRAWLLAIAANQGNSQRSLLEARHLATHERHLGYLRAALAVIPGIGTLIGLHNIYMASQAAAAAWRQEDPEAMALAVAGVAGGVLDVVSSALPVGGALISLRHAVRVHVQARNALELARRPFAGYAAPVHLRDAVALTGRNLGTWRLGNEQYIWQDGRTYAVYRRAEESTLRLRATATRRYEAPVRRDGERWVIHAHTGLRGGGGKLNQAEQVFATWGPGSRHAPFTYATRQQALVQGRRLLGQYRFPDMARAEEFAHAYLVDGAPPAWALNYRQAPGPAPALPVPATGWQQVRWALSDADEIIPGSYGGEVGVRFAAGNSLQQGLRWEGQYYPLVPADGGMERFVMPLGRSPVSLRELDELIRQGTGPVRVRLGDNLAQAPQVLGPYQHTFSERLAVRFPHLSATSRQALGEAVYRRAHPAAQGLTQRRLNALANLFEQRVEPLRELSARLLDQPQVLMNVQSVTDRFNQVRWPLAPLEDATLRRALALQNVVAFKTTLEQAITRRGYQVLFSHATPGRYLTLFRRSEWPEVYALVQRDTLGMLSLQGNHGVAMLSEPWLDMLIARVSNVGLAAVLRAARAQHQLRPLIGGLRVNTRGPAELVWERLAAPSAAPGVFQVRNWRHALRPVQPNEVETFAGSGLYRVEGETLVTGARVDRRLLPLYPAPDSSQVMLSRPASLPSPLTFDALEVCVRERFGEQPWLVIHEVGGWTVRRHLFLAPLDRHVARSRPGLSRQTALNTARHVFERTQGSDHGRLLHLEHVLSSWLRHSQPLDDLADPLLLLAPQQPTGLADSRGWSLALPPDAPITAPAAPAALYLRPVEHYTQGLVAAMNRPRMRHHAPNVIDDMLTRYGLTLDHRSAGFAQYRQPSTGRVYVVGLQVSTGDAVELALEEGLSPLSAAWLVHWQQRLPEAAAQSLTQALANGRMVRLIATLRLGDVAHNGHVVLQRLANF